MPKQFDGQTCVLCHKRPSSPTGEHVWPRWFLKLFPEGDGPYTRLINGEPERRRDEDGVRTYTSAERIKLPCCSECNGILQQRFELSAKSIVRRVMDTDGYLTLSSENATALGLWLLKTWLLLAHPKARSSFPGRSHDGWDLAMIPDDVYGWMVDDKSPPPGFTVWVAREDPGLVQGDDTRRIPLPTVVANGRTTAFQVLRCAVRIFDVTLAYHPGWAIAHPLEIEGRAVRIWPRSEASINLGSLTAVATRDTVWAAGPTLSFAPGEYGTTPLRPLGADWDPTWSDLPGVVFAAAPKLAREI